MSPCPRRLFLLLHALAVVKVIVKDDDDSIFNDNFDDLPERGEVKKGGEGKDSSFTP